MKKIIATTLPMILILISLWVTYAAGWFLIESHPFESWYGFPAFLSLFYVFIASFCLCIDLKFYLEGKEKD